jgi:hypothetical protein
LKISSHGVVVAAIRIRDSQNPTTAEGGEIDVIYGVGKYEPRVSPVKSMTLAPSREGSEKLLIS